MDGKVVVIGSLNYDIILKTDRMPLKGETHNAESSQCCCGGKGGNQVVQCAKLGIPTYMAGHVGNDCYGDILIKGLKAYGVDTAYVRRTSAASGMGIVHTLRDGSVFATITKGANHTLKHKDVDEIAHLLDEHTVLILQMEIPVQVLEYAIQTAASAGCTILFNMAPAMEFDETYMKMCHYLIMNEVEAQFYTGKDLTSVPAARSGLTEFAGKMGNTCIFTLGKQGAMACRDRGFHYKESYCVKAVETTGAGDSFVGGLAYGVLNHMDLSSMLDFATCCSALTVQGTGAQDSMPDIQAVLDFYRNYSK